MASVALTDSGRRHGPQVNAPALLEGSPPLAMASDPAAPAYGAGGGSQKPSAAVIHFLVTLQTKPEFQRLPHQ